MVPYRLLRELSGYNQIYEIEIAIFSVISENNRIFASKIRLYSMIVREQYIKKIQPFMDKPDFP